MGVAENKELVRRFYEEVWDRGNVDFVYEVFTDDYVRHDLRPTKELPVAAGMAKT
jgi:ketosteroid isomerase-like protein